MSASTHPLAPRLTRGIGELGLTLDTGVQQGLLDYLDLLVRWNAAFNLSGIKDPARMVGLHLLDSLSILPLVHGKRIVDVGTGAGLPGIPLALCLPDTHFVLLDSNGKKTRFLLQAVAQLGLRNVQVVNARAEDFREDAPVDMILTRAFATLRQGLQWTGHLMGPDTVFLAMKGQYPHDEVAELPEGFLVRAAHELAIPGEDCSRHVLEVVRRQPHVLNL